MGPKAANTMTAAPSSWETLNGLKDFQRASAEHVFRRLFTDADRVDRFLLADEVGLGKTHVAKGVIAQAVEHLWNKGVKRIDVIYICSNADIARQNIKRLRTDVDGKSDEFELASRVTLLPLHVKALDERRVNFVSFTPGTSLDLGNRAGIQQERELLYVLLRDAWEFHGVGPKNVFQGNTGTQRWRNSLQAFENAIEVGEDVVVNAQLKEAFIREIQKTPELHARFQELCGRFGRDRKVPLEDAQARNALIADLRRILAKTCIEALEPDLVILDEFQRFKTLLETDRDDQVAELAQQLFSYRSERPDERAKVLLVSATPYRMYSLAQEDPEVDHYEDFILTAKFLFNQDDEVRALEGDLKNYRAALAGGSVNLEAASVARSSIERRLRRVMCRNERLGVNTDRNGMLHSLEHPTLPTERDLQEYQFMDTLSRTLEAHDVMDLWKSSPYLINLMDEHYDLKRRFAEAVETEEPAVCALLEKEAGLLFPTETLHAYGAIDPGNAKLRALISATVGSDDPTTPGGGWELLWIPACMPYYQPGGAYAEAWVANFTKTLIFSSWLVVPKAIAMLTSYEAERRVVRRSNPQLRYEDHRKQGNRLRIAKNKERLAGLNVFTLLYPCVTLARAIDPLRNKAALLLTMTEALEVAAAKVSELLAPHLASAPVDGPVDESWYWAAPLLLDGSESYVADWLNADEDPFGLGGSNDTEESEDDERFSAHLEAIRATLKRESLPTGRPPEDLAMVLAKVALGSPAVVALRAFLRHWPEPSRLLRPAAVVAAGFRTLFNLPDSVMLLREADGDGYWQRVLEYGVQGNLQSVLDEYVHVLNPSSVESPQELADSISNALTLRTTTAAYDHIASGNSGALEITKRTVRCRYAVRFGEGKSEDEAGEPTRADQVRDAFNSPFRPFVLASTSVGQEGLDFHHYCHSIWHWNLPSNPVDLEQREGRIHRFKSHVIRKNVAASSTSSGGLAEGDPWQHLFDEAVLRREPGGSEMVPFWIHEGDHKISRQVPLYPLSRDEAQYQNLIHTLARYRLVLGQPRQEDLLKLMHSMDPEVVAAIRPIDLSPPPIDSAPNLASTNALANAGRGSPLIIPSPPPSPSPSPPDPTHR